MSALALGLMVLATAEGGAADVVLPQCGLPLPITRHLLDTLADDRMTGAAWAGGAVLVGDLPGPRHGSVVFLRTAGKWQAFSAAPGAALAGLFRARGSGAIFVWTMPVGDQPGQQFDGLSMNRVGEARFCTRVPFPTEPDTLPGQGKILSLTSFNIDGRGGAALVGTATVMRPVAPAETGKRKRRDKRQAAPEFQPVKLHYRYVSQDGGRRWSTPQLVSAAGAPGLYERVIAAPRSLVASLRGQGR